MFYRGTEKINLWWYCGMIASLRNYLYLSITYVPISFAIRIQPEVIDGPIYLYSVS